MLRKTHRHRRDISDRQTTRPHDKLDSESESEEESAQLSSVRDSLSRAFFPSLHVARVSLGVWGGGGRRKIGRKIIMAYVCPRVTLMWGIDRMIGGRTRCRRDERRSVIPAG